MSSGARAVMSSVSAGTAPAVAGDESAAWMPSSQLPSLDASAPEDVVLGVPFADLDGLPPLGGDAGHEARHARGELLGAVR